MDGEEMDEKNNRSKIL